MIFSKFIVKILIDKHIYIYSLINELRVKTKLYDQHVL